LIPFADALLAYVGFPLFWSLRASAGVFADSFHAAARIAALTGATAAVVTVVGAVPVVLALMRRGSLSLGRLLAAGVILANAPFLWFVAGIVLPMTLLHLIDGTLPAHLAPASDVAKGTVAVLAVGTIFGAWSALVLWFVGLRDNSRLLIV